MNNKKPAELSNEELISNEKRMKAITIAFAVILTLSFAATFILILQEGFTVSIVTPIALLPLLVIFVNNWKGLKQEIKSRNLR